MVPGLDLKLMLIPFTACLVVSLLHVYLGIHVISRKVIFVDLALAQIAALGATYAVTLGYDPLGDSFKVSLFSLLFAFVGAGAFAIARMKKERVPQEAFIGIIYAAASAMAILILSKSATGGEELKHMLVGDLLLVSVQTVINVAILYGIIGLFHIVFRKKFLAISLDPEAAEASGIKVRFWDILFYMSFGIVITKSVAMVGVLLVFSYLVVPAVIAQMWSNTIRGRLLLGWVMAILASVVGIRWSFVSDYPTGPAVVVTLALFLVAASVIYYLKNAPSKAKAFLSVAAIAAFAVLFLGGLNYFKKIAPVEQGASSSPVDILLKELNEDEEAHQLDSVSHLGEMKDPRIVPALSTLLEKTSSEQVVEAVVEALGQQKDPRAVPALKHAAEKDYDDFMKYTIGRAQLGLGDRDGFKTLILILKNDEAGFARQQALELLEGQSRRKFGYDPQKTVAQNADALKRIDDWWKKDAPRLKWNAKDGVFS